MKQGILDRIKIKHEKIKQTNRNRLWNKTPASPIKRNKDKLFCRRNQAIKETAKETIKTTERKQELSENKTENPERTPENLQQKKGYQKRDTIFAKEIRICVNSRKANKKLAQWTIWKASATDRTYKCENCGLMIDRDLNSAINILKAGLQKVEKTTIKNLPTDCGDVCSANWRHEMEQVTPVERDICEAKWRLKEEQATARVFRGNPYIRVSYTSMK